MTWGGKLYFQKHPYSAYNFLEVEKKHLQNLLLNKTSLKLLFKLFLVTPTLFSNELTAKSALKEDEFPSGKRPPGRFMEVKFYWDDGHNWIFNPDLGALQRCIHHSPPTTVDGNQKSGKLTSWGKGSWNPIIYDTISTSQVGTLAGFRKHQQKKQFYDSDCTNRKQKTRQDRTESVNGRIILWGYGFVQFL